MKRKYKNKNIVQKQKIDHFTLYVRNNKLQYLVIINSKCINSWHSTINLNFQNLGTIGSTVVQS